MNKRKFLQRFSLAGLSALFVGKAAQADTNKKYDPTLRRRRSDLPASVENEMVLI